MNRLRSEWLHLPQAGAQHRAPPGTRAVVVGGGIAGIAAATVLSERGVQVTLLEREAQLGGRASAWKETLKTGEQIGLERGFHGFFRQYYNLRALLRRVDPQLANLHPLHDYPVLGPGGAEQSFRQLNGLAPLRALKLAWRTPYLGLTDLPRIDKQLALQLLAYDAEQTYEGYDTQSAAAFLDALGFPPRARRMLLDVFSHSFFNPEAELSAAELMMMFHFYFTANPEGLIFDVAARPMSTAFWEPFERWLELHGANVQLSAGARRVHEKQHGGFAVEHTAGVAEGDLLVLALDVAGLKRLLDASPDLREPELRARVNKLEVTRPFAVLRLWLDRPLAPARAAFAGTTGVGRLDNITLYDRFQDESAAWARTHAGSVVELHAYAIDPLLDLRALRSDLIAGLNAFYPESRVARVVDERLIVRHDCPAFAPSSQHQRPTPSTRLPNLTIAGDFMRMPFPCALMERAAASGMLAANTLLAQFALHPNRYAACHDAVYSRRCAQRERAQPQAHRMQAELMMSQLRRRLLRFGRRLPPAVLTDRPPDWEQADPAWIRRALRRAEARPSGGWYVVDASRAITERPRCVQICSRSLVVWRIGDRSLAAPNACPHMGAPLSDGTVQNGRLVCPWHGLALGVEGHARWKPLPTYDDGVLLWVRMDARGESATQLPQLPQRPRAYIDSVIRVEAACDPRDVLANRLDPWHGVHFHPHAFGRVQVVDQSEEEIVVRVAYRVLRRLVMEVDARFHCPDPRTIVMTIVRGDGLGSIVETHATPTTPGHTAIIEATLATSDRIGFGMARRVARAFRPLIERRARRLWREDAAYAERLYALRRGTPLEYGNVISLNPPRRAR